jgi:hypothetical protein
MKKLFLLVILCVAGCTAVQVSRAKQTADVICANVATGIGLVRSSPEALRLAAACLDRLERNEQIEAALLAGIAGAPTVPPSAGAAGAP